MTSNSRDTSPLNAWRLYLRRFRTISDKFRWRPEDKKTICRVKEDIPEWSSSKVKLLARWVYLKNYVSTASIIEVFNWMYQVVFWVSLGDWTFSPNQLVWDGSFRSMASVKTTHNAWKNGIRNLWFNRQQEKQCRVDVETHRRGWAPTNKRIRRAILLCKFHCSTATATINPPRNSTFVSLKYGVETSLEPKTPNNGKRTSGRRAVTANSTTSVTQYTAMIRMQ